MDKKFCVIGKSLPHTFSPEIHGMFGLDYGVVELPEVEDLQNFVKTNTYDGFNVTIPYKQDIMHMLDHISQDAMNMGAVNTVVRKNGELYGYNTDVEGIRYALKHGGIDVTNKKVAILGSGGTSHTAKYAIKDMAKEIIVVSRTGDINYNNIYDIKDIDIIINTTPVGMYPNTNPSPIDLEQMPSVTGVFDAIYNPLRTTLLLQAESLGMKTANGLGMLVEQARVARDLFVGDETNENLSDFVLEVLYKKKRNIVFIGMPGSGKTTFGRLLAKELGKTFIDIDSEIVNREGMTIPAIFEEKGEEYFRNVEMQVVAEFSLKFNQVISTGGGSPLNKDNRINLKHNGFVILVDRDVDSLETDGRPLSISMDLKEMLERRMPIYNKAKDAQIFCDGNIENTLRRIREVLWRKF